VATAAGNYLTAEDRRGTQRNIPCLAGKQETQENRKGMIAIFLSREGMKPPAADREGRDATETFSR
jgi:hypothetical protein